jgi:hypothetical protein
MIKWFFCIGLCIIISAFLYFFCKTSTGNPKIDELRKILAPLFSTKKVFSKKLDYLNHHDILKEVGIYPDSQSYTINKKNIYLCLFDENGNYYPNKMLLFVLFHEISHIICQTYGHTNEFQEIFDQLLLEASKEKIFDSSYKIINNYCPANV